MDKKETTVFLRCDCHCSMLVVDKTVWKDGDVSFNLSVQDSRYDHNYTTLWGKLKNALTILIGKPVYYSGVYIGDTEKIRNFVEQLKAMCCN